MKSERCPRCQMELYAYCEDKVTWFTRYYECKDCKIFVRIMSED